MFHGVHDDSNSNGHANCPLGVGITLEDLQCPICVETIKDPFVTRCGHTFCFTCITTHLKNKRVCPSCDKYITQDHIHPNWLLKNISHKASTINPGTPSSLLDHVTRLLSTSTSSIKVHEVQQVIELLEATKTRLQEQENTNNMELLLLFLQHARTQKAQQLHELQRQMHTLQHDLSSARMRCERGTTTSASGASTMLPYPSGPQQMDPTNAGLPPLSMPPGLPPLSMPPGPRLLPAASMQMPGPHLPPAASMQQPGAPMLAPPPISVISAEAFSHLPQGPAPPSGSLGSQPPPCTSNPVGFRPYASSPAPGTSQPVPAPPLQAAPSTSAPLPPLAPAVPNPTSNSNSTLPLIVPTPTTDPPPVRPRAPHRESAPVSSSAHSFAGTVSGPDPPPPAALIAPPAPPSAANEALRAAKRRRIMMQFDELQQCYLRLRHTSSSSQDDPTSAIGPIDDDEAGLDLFTQMLCAATHYAKLSVVAELPRATSRASILSSIEFDMDEQLFATAGVTQKISVYEFATIMAAPKEAHSPVVEIPTRSKLSCISWSPGVRHHLISSDYEGTVQLWDVAARTSIQEFEAHERRIWSVDFSPTEPQHFASGSDDGKVKVWSANEPSPVINIDVKANVCSVQYNPSVSHSLAVGSANHSVLLYDLRRARDPLARYTGHRKAVSYVRFVNSFELVSASTDSTLRLWDTRANTCARVFSGHGNEKNFVGLSVDGEFIACGSESNRVYVYYKAIPKPTMYHSFSGGGGEGGAGGAGATAAAGGAVGAAAGGGAAAGAEAGQFVTAVCWKKGFNHLVAANSSGSIWIMSLVD